MQRGRLLIKRIVAMVMSIVLTLSLLLGCNFRKDSQVGISLSETDIDKIVETTSGKILDELNTQPTVDEINASSEEIFISNNWEDYIGDIETFVYGLITNELQYKYDVFPAYVELADGVYVSGIAYTDYSECYTNEDESHCYFTAGLLPFYGEVEISDEDFNSGLILYNMDYTDENTSFILTYLSDEFTEHCIVYGQYLKYGVNEIGQVTYQAEEYVKGQCDESLGALYSYDEGRYVFDDGSGDYVLLSGISLYSQIDYEELEKEINAVLETQDVNFADVDVKSYAYIAQEAVTSYLLSMQDETFLGYNVNELVQMAETLDPLQCLRITNEGIAVVDIEAAPAEGGEAIVKWLVGTSCVIVTAVGFVCDIALKECPVLSASIGAVAGVAIEVFMQVVISGVELGDIAWNQVAIAAATGAVSGLLGGYISSKFGRVAATIVDSALDGLLGGIEQAVIAWLNGSRGAEIIDSFGYGLALGVALSSGFKGASKVIAKVADKLEPAVTKLAKNVFPELVEKVSKYSQDVSSFVVNKVIVPLQKKAETTVFYSKYLASEMAQSQCERVIDKEAMEVLANPIHIKTKNEGFANQRHPETGVEYRKRIFVVDNEVKEGVFPVFPVKDRVTLPEDLKKASDNVQFKYCTEQLAKKIEKDPKLAARFTPLQLKQIKANEPRIAGLTWHHSEVSGEMELVDAVIHAKSGHTGGRDIWGGGSDNR